jgi:hypothetical protein
LLDEWEMPQYGMVCDKWVRELVRHEMPYVVSDGDTMRIVHSLVPCEPGTKRARTE